MKAPLLTLTLFLALLECSSAQTPPLTPSGPPTDPATAMKSLNQIEPRTPIPSQTWAVGNWTPIQITSPGSYYLTGPVRSPSDHTAIAILSDDVTLDLNGFTVHSAPGGGSSPASAILVEGTYANVVIKNGNVKGSAVFDGNTVSNPATVLGSSHAYGIRALNSNPSSTIRVENINVSGMKDKAISIGNGTASNCIVDVVAGTGIEAGAVERCVVTRCLGTGIAASGNVFNCKVEGVYPVGGAPSGAGEYGITGQGVVSHCVVFGFQKGILADGVVTDCTAQGLQGSPGIQASLVSNCVAGGSALMTIVAPITRDCILNGIVLDYP